MHVNFNNIELPWSVDSENISVKRLLQYHHGVVMNLEIGKRKEAILLLNRFDQKLNKYFRT